MKIQFVKNYLSYKAEQVETIEDADLAADLIAKGYAKEVKEEKNEVEGIVDSIASKVESIAEEAAVKAVEKVSKSFAARKASIVVGPDGVDSDPKHGFKSFGDFAMQVKRGSGEALNRYMKAAAGHSVGTNADGGYAVPEIWANEIFSDIQAGENLLPLTRQFPMTVGDTLHIPADNTTTIGNGMTAAWTAEAGTISPTKTALRDISLTPYKLALLTATTEELERDAQALQAYLTDRASYQLNYAINNAIVRGNGSSKPTGFVGHAATVAVPRETANDITFKDIGNMYARFYGDKTKAVWLVNQEAFPRISRMTSGNYNVFLTNSSVQGAPSLSMFGLPVVVSEHMSTLGSQADIALVDLSKYFTAIKGGVEAAQSIHLYFASNENAYRWTVRLDGKPSRAAAITPASGQGSRTLSPFVVLDSTTTTTP